MCLNGHAMRIFSRQLLMLLLFASGQAASPLPWGDQGDGTYRNPILPADYSDPDVIRVGDDFYLVASEFHFIGIQVLRSRDLENWQIISRVFDRLPMDAKYDEMKGYSQGTWAPSLRYHNGRFYLYACTPRDGLYCWTAKDPAGPWSDAITVKTVEQREDPCPFWDDDGQAYLVHGKLGAGPLILHKMSPDGTRLLDDGVAIYRGPVSEGPKLFKRHGWYYISLPEGGVERGGQSMLRSRNLYGPYERRVVVPDGGPHQGGIVDLDNGESWFIGFKSAGYLGRVPCLQPVKWGDDDWPVFGDAGRPVISGKKPAVGQGFPVAHPQTDDDFDAPILQPQWQWNHNPAPSAWSLAERPGWLRLHGLPAAEPALARNTLTQKLWGESGTATVKIDGRHLTDGQRAGLAFMSGKIFNAIGVVRAAGMSRIFWDGAIGPELAGDAVWLRGEYHGDAGRLSCSLDGTTFTDTGLDITLKFSQWKGARFALFCYGDGGGAADFDWFHFQPGTDPVPLTLPDATPIDRRALVTGHNPVVRRVDPMAPLTVGNGGFAFTVDVTGLQTFGDYYYQNGIPLETLARWCWVSDENPHHFKLADTNQDYRKADGTIIALPSRLDTPASDWLRENPRMHPLGQLALEWDKPDGTPFVPADVQEPEQTLDLWRGVITSRYKLGGVPVTVTTACDSRSDTVAVRIDSDLVKQGKLRVRLAFPRGHDPAVKNTPPLDWSHPEMHQSRLLGFGSIERVVGDTHYFVSSNRELHPLAPHQFAVVGDAGGNVLAFTLGFSARSGQGVTKAETVLEDSSAFWENFWRGGAAVDFSGSTNPLANKLEERVVLSRYLTAVQCVGDMPPQESGLTCNTWYGKHHTEMIWWHTAHFILWGQSELAKKNLDWFLAHLSDAKALAASRGLRGARWAKMVGPDDRESPGGNPLIVWNQPHLIYLCDLLLRQSPSAENLAKYRELVDETAECLASMLVFDPSRGQYVLGPPLWIAEEIHDPATSQNPSFELAYWRWALETAQRWRIRSGQPRKDDWDHIIAHLPPLPQKDGKYVALESQPDTWDDRASRHDHPEMLMPLGFLPETPSVDRATMNRTLDGVLKEWDWDAKIFGWDYPMVAMTATRLGRPADAIEILLRDGPNNRYTPNGHCPQGSDRAQTSQAEGRREIAVYLPANGAFLSAVALMVAGWDGSTGEFPGFPKDGSWKIRAEGLQRLP
jgi:beta-xylosidase